MDAISEQALDALAAAARRAAEEPDLGAALKALAEAACEAVEAETVVIRLADEQGRLVAHTIAARSEAVGAELEGSSFPLTQLPNEEASGDALPEAVRRAAKRTRASDALLLPVWVGRKPLGSLELLRAQRPFAPNEILAARLAASHLGLVLRALKDTNGAGAPLARALVLAGDALAAGLDHARAAGEVVRIAAGAAGAEAALLWRAGEKGAVEVLASAGALASLEPFSRAAERAFAEHEQVRIEPEAGEPGRPVATLRLGQPPVGVLQLVYPAGAGPSPGEVDRLATFAVRAAQALRAGERSREMSLELERTQALLAVVSQAIAELSLSHTLETVVARVSELLGSDRVAVYLREGTRLRPEAGTGAEGRELAVAERLLELAFGPLRAQGMLHVTDAVADVRLAPVREAVSEAGIEAALAVPLVAREELIGLLAAYLPRGRELSEGESSLLTALTSQLAVAVQNADLHEKTERLAAELEKERDAERETARQVGALYDISRSFAQSLSLDDTLRAVTRAAVELLEADAAVIRMGDERGEQLVERRSYVADERLGAALRPLLTQDQAVEQLPGRRVFRLGQPLVLDPDQARRLGPSYELLVPFLEQGATGLIVPVATQAELLATVTVISLNPEHCLGTEEIRLALSLAGPAALAIQNARLSQERKDFQDTMQRSLLPRGLPQVEGLDVGAVYESSARRVEVGGDVYDFLPLPDGRLAVVLGDVSGHGIAATADMALAKFAFRSLVRHYQDPGELLGQVNEVAVGELSSGSFVTMLCLTIDPSSGEVRAASAGHPPARLLAADGSVSALAPGGLALGVEGSQHYEELTTTLAPGAALCLYTDGLVEARSDGVPYGDDRLDAALASGRELPAPALAKHVVADCRAFAGEPEDDFAVVVIRRG